MSAASILAIALATAAAAKAPERGDVRRGWVVFVSKACIRCHATWGYGGEIGPDLGRTRAGGLSDAELAATVWSNIPRMWGKMKEERIPHVPIDQAEMRNLFAYLSFVRALDAPGDPETGRRLLREKSCTLCHTVTDAKGATAPDLRRWARYRNPAVWAKLMFDHAPKMIQAMRARGLLPPRLEASDLVHIVSYVRSVAASGEAELLEPGDTIAGERLFHERKCVLCHSVRGAGGTSGPALGFPGWATSFTGVAVKVWNRVGGMREEMRKMRIEAPVLTPQEMAHVIAWLFAATYSDDPGSPARGARLLGEKGCTRCHQGAVAQPLRRFAGQATAATLAHALWKHGPVMLEAMRGMGIRWPTFTGDEMRDLIAVLNAPPDQE